MKHTHTHVYTQLEHNKVTTHPKNRLSAFTARHTQSDTFLKQHLLSQRQADTKLKLQIPVQVTALQRNLTKYMLLQPMKWKRKKACFLDTY